MDELEGLFQQCLDTWGPEIQIIMLIEELSELQKELCKWFRDPGNNREGIAEELADVALMMGQVRYQMKLTEVFDKYVKLKVERLRERLKEEENGSN